jgi:hypothetical protein
LVACGAAVTGRREVGEWLRLTGGDARDPSYGPWDHTGFEWVFGQVVGGAGLVKHVRRIKNELFLVSELLIGFWDNSTSVAYKNGALEFVFNGWLKNTPV